MNTYKIKIGFNYIDNTNNPNIFYWNYYVLGNDESDANQNIYNYLINDTNTFNITIEQNVYNISINNFTIIETILI